MVKLWYYYVVIVYGLFLKERYGWKVMVDLREQIVGVCQLIIFFEVG